MKKHIFYGNKKELAIKIDKSTRPFEIDYLKGNPKKLYEN